MPPKKKAGKAKEGGKKGAKKAKTKVEDLGPVEWKLTKDRLEQVWGSHTGPTPDGQRPAAMFAVTRTPCTRRGPMPSAAAHPTFYLHPVV